MSEPALSYSGGAPPHVLVLPLPCQGHVTPLMELSHRLVHHGCHVTFLNSEFDHARITAVLADAGETLHGIHLAAIPDGMDDGEDRRDLNRLADGVLTTMPGRLEGVIADINARSAKEGRGKIRWVIADESMGWCFAVARKLGIRTACFWPASAACLAIMLKIPQLIEGGVLDERGLPVREETFRLTPEMPPIKTTEMPWNRAGDPSGQQIIFQLVAGNNKNIDLAETIVCNTFHDAEAAALSLFPTILPVGPLQSDDPEELKRPVGHFWTDDTSCLGWLDGQPDKSVVYAAFGSFTVFGARQFEELAAGLELIGRPFLWVVRPDFTASGSLSEEWLNEFEARVGRRGKLVRWCPQPRVLAHPAVACFLSHCGWNSTMEGVWNGVPFLCWPYFCDQLLNQSYICNVWKNGIPMVIPPADGSGGEGAGARGGGGGRCRGRG